MCDFLDEFDYLIHLIKSAIHNEQPREIPDGLRFDMVYRYGVYHHVANIAFYSVVKLEKKPDLELYREWEECCNRAVVRDFTQSFARDEIVAEFEQADIRYLEPQGTHIKKLYPQPEYRTMSDLDFMIDPENLSKARDVLEHLGYECKEMNDVDVNGFRPPNINVEVHTSYFPRNSEFYDVMRLPFSTVEETGEYNVNELYIYNLLHIAKHYNAGGFGIRRVLDVYYLNLHYGKILDWQYVVSVFKSAKVENFVKELTSLASQWFADGEGNAERSELAVFVLGSGLHGTWRNFLSRQLKASHHEDGSFFKVKYFFRRLIGTKENMYITYPVLKRWKVLYPFCWIHRVFSVIKPSKRKRISLELKTMISTDGKK